MNREILFRGKRVDNGEWVEGGFAERSNNQPIGNRYKSFIFKPEYGDWGFSVFEQYEVKTETVGQFTGINDKNGRKIFDGDICEIKTKYGFHSELLNEFKDEKNLKSINDIVSHFTGIIRIDLLRGLMFENPQNGYAEPMFNRLRKIFAYFEISGIEVIGSIYDKEGV